jgi:hypothetical protein
MSDCNIKNHDSLGNEVLHEELTDDDELNVVNNQGTNSYVNRVFYLRFLVVFVNVFIKAVPKMKC